MTLSLDLQIATTDDSVPSRQDMAAWADGAVTAAQPGRAAEITVRVVDENESRELNRQFRGKNSATNVLSFASGPLSGLPEGTDITLGDIVVCAPVVRAEAVQQGKDISAHWAHMIVHGTLHLLGYDHQAETDATAMESLEKEVLGNFEIEDPYLQPT